MLKVISVIPANRGLTGATLALVHILMGVVRRGVHVEVITSPEALRYPAFRRLVKAGAVCRILRIGSFPSPLYWLLLNIKLVLSGRHGIAHFSTPKTFLLMYPAALLVAKKRVLTLEGYAPNELADAGFAARTLGMLSWQLGLKLADRITACSEWLRRIVEKEHGYGWKLSTVYNPIDHDRFTPLSNEKTCGPVLLVARLHRVKGVDTALKAISHLRRKNLRVPELWVIGDGEEMENLKNLSLELGIEDVVDFLGSRFDVENYVGRASLVLMPSRYEPFGMPAAEAGAAGKPVVASAVGGLKEIVEDGVTGLLFKPDDYAELAEKIENLLADEEMKKRMGEAGRKKVLEKFTPDVVAAEVIRVYLDALKT